MICPLRDLRHAATSHRLIDRLRTLARPSERPRHSLDVRAPVREVLELVQPAFEEKRIAITARIGESPTLVFGDHDELKQLLLNLLMNSHEATPPDGALTIDVHASSSSVTVAISDTGPGTPAEILERIFDPFFTTKQHGSGLGLAICAGIAAAHGAKLRAANRPAGGACFTLEFPLATTVAAEVAA